MKDLVSHTKPPLKLSEHIEQVREAASAIWKRHSDRLILSCSEVRLWVNDGVRLHDVGKGGAAFQQYILAPEKYRGDKLSKAHTPLSFVSVMSQGRTEAWDWRRRLAVAVLAACHHSGFKTRDELENIVADYRKVDAIEEQLRTFDWDAIDSAIGIALPRLPPGSNVCSEVLDDLTDVVFPSLDHLLRASLDEAISFRLRCQLALSILLEADKAFLAVKAEHLTHYLSDRDADLPPKLVDALLAKKPSTPLDPLRREAREAMLAGLRSIGDGRIHTMTLPTGLGKTLLAATWALELRQRLRSGIQAPKVVIVLPYLSIIDQTQAEYRRLLADEVADGHLLSYHSLSERVFDPESDLDDNSSAFFVDTWRSDIVITTFDQFLFALLSPKARHQIRFHQLCDALIVMDEVQTLPCRLWNPLAKGLEQLTKLGSTYVLAMSATQPRFLGRSGEIIHDPEHFFGRLGRYRLRLRHRSPMQFGEFITEILVRLADWKGRRVLLVLNTRSSARRVRDALFKAGAEGLHFLTADVTPSERLQEIDEIKRGEPALVVATQCVEAGVDIDLELVIRDFGPLDSIIQVAGRCNRNGQGVRGDVEIVNLLDDKSGKPFAEMIYDRALLQATRQVLQDGDIYPEEEVFGLSERYFEVLRCERDQGEQFTRAWAAWEQTDPVRELLRGPDVKQESFLVAEQDERLIDDLGRVALIADRWARRLEYRKLAARIARVSVSVYARREFDPSRFADRDPMGFHWVLRPGFYKPGRGLDLRLPDVEPNWGIIL